MICALVTGVQTCALPIWLRPPPPASTGQVMPNHPRLAISSGKARSGAAIQVSSVRDALAAAVRPTSRASACSSSSSGERAKSMPGNLPPTRSRAGVGAPSGEEDELAELPAGFEGLVGAGGGVHSEGGLHRHQTGRGEGG